MLVRSGILLVKLWSSVSQAEQQTRSASTPHAPWTVVKSNDMKRARPEAMRHILSLHE